MHDFYSDTQTRPSRAMREAILDIPVGDERHLDDPSTNALCEQVAQMLGKEAAMFLPSGTMCNQIAIAVHCDPGDEIICTRESHILFAESGASAAMSGVMHYPIDASRGMMTPDQVADAIRPRSSHAPRSRLLCSEQTVNLAGGAIWPAEQLFAVAKVAHDNGLATRLDGARLLNAVVAMGTPASVYAEGYDSAWIAFSKGLGCPVGSVLAGTQEFIDRAWLFKRRWGGAMRQIGVLTAMCLYALENNVERLAEDHELASDIALRLAGVPIAEHVHPVETNIILVDLKQTGPDAREAVARLKEDRVILTAVGHRRLRIVTHMDVNAKNADALVQAMSKLS
jgi:threonine aldolase